MFIPALHGFVRTLRRKKRFSAVLHETLGEAVQWWALPFVEQIAFTLARSIADAPSEELQKGQPDLWSVRRSWAELILKHIDQLAAHTSDGSEMFHAAAHIASISPDDVNAFRLYLAVFWIVNHKVIMALRDATRSPYIAVHMTCGPRIERAEKSIDSFAAIPSDVLTHIKLIGNGTKFDFDPKQKTLAVPAGDAYEHLPAKLFLCYQLLVMSCNPACIIKLDDDHRLGDQRALLSLLNKAAGSRSAAQFGYLRKVAFPSAHNRGWHIGKCADEAISRQPVEMPVPLTFISGEFGYILNRQALWRAAWAALYYRQWLDHIIYEDVAVSEVAEKTWIAKHHFEMSQSLSAVAAY